jgi:hypothetical protein
MKWGVGEFGRGLAMILVAAVGASCDSWPPGRPSGPWPGADQAAFDEMAARTRCRSTLGAPDCRVVPAPMPTPPSGAPAAIAPPAVPGGTKPVGTKPVPAPAAMAPVGRPTPLNPVPAPIPPAGPAPASPAPLSPAPLSPASTSASH